MPHLNRREALRALGGATMGAGLFTQGSLAEAVRAGRAIRDTVPGPRALETLNPHQDATVVVLAELILPATDTPGATAAGVNEFIDLILTEWYEPEETERFLTGLAQLDSRSQSAFSASFVDATSDQQHNLLRELDGELTRRVTSDDPAGPPPRQHFFYQMKRLTLTGYYTSEVGMLEELKWRVIPGAYRPCEPVEDLRRG